MNIDPNKYQKYLTMFVVILISSLCIVFWVISTVLFIQIEDKRVSLVFFIVTSIFSLCWVLVYKFYILKIK